MKYRIKNPKRTITMLSIVMIIITIISLICFFSYKPKGETVAKLEGMEERKIQDIDGEYIDIEELEKEQEGESQKEQNVIEGNEPINEAKNETINKPINNGKNTINTIPYYIKVNYGAQVVTIYKQDEQGNYTIPVKAMVCSTGVATPTSGVYSIPEKWEWLPLQGDVFGHYCTQIKGNILFHSVPYLRKKDPASLEYWEYDKLGTYASAGCIRLMVKDAKWIYDNCARGTKVEFYSSSNPGPLGKPSAKKITSYPDYLRNWDPTDPNASNPWKTYKETTPTIPKDDPKTNTTQNNTINETPSNTIQNKIENEVTNNQENDKANIINEEIEGTKNNNITNEIEDKTTNQQQNKIKNEAKEEKQNTIKENSEEQKSNMI